ADGHELIESARAITHDLVLLDLSMPGATGLELVKQLKRERPKIPVVILTMYTESQFAVRALKAGAVAYLLKDSAAGELTSAIRKVASGGRYLTPRLAEQLADYLGD